jgi:DNA-binding NtrC family response regulator
MAGTRDTPTVAIIDSSEDIVNMLREFFEHEGFRTATAHVALLKRGEQDLLKFLAEHDPAVVVYDIAPPYAPNWTFFRLVQNLKAMEGRHVVLTTTNRHALEAVAGEIEVYELIDKPYDLDTILQAVRQGLGRR